MGLPWQLSGKESTCNVGDVGSIPGSGRSPWRRIYLFFLCYLFSFILSRRYSLFILKNFVSFFGILLVSPIFAGSSLLLFWNSYEKREGSPFCLSSLSLTFLSHYYHYFFFSRKKSLAGPSSSLIFSLIVMTIVLFCSSFELSF